MAQIPLRFISILLLIQKSPLQGFSFSTGKPSELDLRAGCGLGWIRWEVSPAGISACCWGSSPGLSSEQARQTHSTFKAARNPPLELANTPQQPGPALRWSWVQVPSHASGREKGPPGTLQALRLQQAGCSPSPGLIMTAAAWYQLRESHHRARDTRAGRCGGGGDDTEQEQSLSQPR